MRGMYVNVGNELLREAMNSKIYVDKSMLIAELNDLIETDGKFICVSRPRRFGKSMAGAMIAAYYSKGCDSRELFDRLKISGDPSYESRLNKMNVIKLDMNDFLQNTDDKSKIIENLTETVKEELQKVFSSIALTQKDTLATSIKRIYNDTGETFILIIDEYDVLVREKVLQQILDLYLAFLSSLFKNQTLKPAISLAYLMGILPIVRDKIQSKMNEFDEYSMLNARQLSEFVGFTKDEVKDLCEKYNMDFAECERWYDGYHLTPTLSIYSPSSIVQAMRDRRYMGYWTATGSYEALKNYILMDFDGIKQDVIKMMSGARIRVNVSRYMNTMTDFSSKDDVFTYLIHLGYLAYDIDTEQCYIPNSEVRNEWVNSIECSPDYKVIIEMVNDSRDLLKRTIEGDEDAVAAALRYVKTETNLTLIDENNAHARSSKISPCPHGISML